MKGALGLIVISAVVWIFWMTAVWVKRTRENKNKNNDKKEG